MLKSFAITPFIIVCFFSCNAPGIGKNQSKPILGSYSGGEPGLAGIHLILYIDSTYKISGWTDDNRNDSSEGKYVIHDSSIALYPKRESRNGKQVKLKDTVDNYRIRKNAVLLYSKEDEMKHPEAGEFQTLYLDKKQK